MMFAGVFDRYPKLRVGAIEYEAAWAAYFLDKMDNVYTQRPVDFVPRFSTDAIPSDLFHNSVFISFQEDALAVRLRDHIGINCLCWGSDYPHAESTFPRSREIVAGILEGVPDDEKAKIAGGNTARLFRFD